MINQYGCRELNGIPDNYLEEVASQIDHKNPVRWTERGLQITRLRLIRDRWGGRTVFAVSYCHGTLNGKPVRVALPFSMLPYRGWGKEIIREAKLAGVYAKGLGIFDNTSILY